MVTRRRTRGAPVATCAAALLLACNTNFAPQYLVSDLRILSVRAEVVGAAPAADGDVGDTIRLTALVANPQQLPGVTVRWKACLPVPGQAISPCADTSALSDPGAIGGPDVLDLGEGVSVEVTVPQAVAPFLQTLIDRAHAEPALACTLYAELPVLAIASAPGARTRVAVKTARLTPYREVPPDLAGAYAPNGNPALEAVRIGVGGACGGPFVARPCATDADCGSGTSCRVGPPGSPTAPGQCLDALPPGAEAICATVGAAQAEAYEKCSQDGTRALTFESLDFQWYVTAGSFKEGGAGGIGNGNVTDEQVTFTPPAGPFTMWVIVRDERGGEGWLERDFP